jgi:hypothetical protein
LPVSFDFQLVGRNEKHPRLFFDARFRVELGVEHDGLGGDGTTNMYAISAANASPLSIGSIMISLIKEARTMNPIKVERRR